VARFGSLVAAVTAVLALAAPAGAAPGTRPPHPFIGAGELEQLGVPVRAAPSAGARVIARLPQFRPDYRPTTILALGVRAVGGKPAWYRISVPGRPNGRTGWIRASATQLRPVRRQIVIHLGARTLELWTAEGKRELVTTVAVGAPGMETPTGLFYVTVPFRPVQQTFLGVYAFETSAYSKLSEWPGGGKVGIHGTYQPQLLGQAVSHGCVRVSNAAAAFLRDRVPVGTPIRIVP
jgi:lipoprotein-anchoring transpeptidase ErfK/SrfK